MAYSNGKITAPVSVTDIKNALGVSSNKLSALCTSSNINMWAYYKPVDADTTEMLTDAQRIAANQGLTPKEISGLTGAYIETIPTPEAWTYKKPSKYYRMCDFTKYGKTGTTDTGYNHNAAAAVSGVADKEIKASQFNSLPTYTFNCKYGEASYDSIGSVGNVEIPINKLTLISGSPVTDGNWRLALAIFVPLSSGGYNIYYAAQPSVMLSSSSTNGQAIDLSYSGDLPSILKTQYNAGTRELTAIPFFAYKIQYITNDTSRGYNYFSMPSNGRAFSLPGGETIKIKLVSVASSITVNCDSASLKFTNPAGATLLLVNDKGYVEYTKNSSLTTTITAKITYKGDTGTSPYFVCAGATANEKCVIEKWHWNSSLNTPTYEKETVTELSTTADDDFYMLTATESTTGSQSSIASTLNNRTAYDGSSTTNYNWSLDLRFLVGSETVTKTLCSFYGRPKDS